jgi:hypothetical protein
MTLSAKVLPGNLAAPLYPRPRATPRTAVNGSVAPVCPISKSEPVPIAAPTLPVPPPAFDLPSAILAINQMRQIINIILNPPPNLNLSLLLPFPIPVWHETNRKMVTERVYNPDDASMWVDVQHISMLEMTDKTLGTTMTLMYQAPKAGGVGTAPTTGGGTTPTGPGGPVQTPGQ